MSRYTRPQLNIFIAAFSSPLCLVPQCTTFPLQDIDKSNYPPLNSQQQQVWDVSSPRLITLRAPPYFSAFLAKNVRNFLAPFFRKYLSIISDSQPFQKLV
ncbi:MAG: hypothetical protein O4808_02050 [Trichodesmium sp. St17_bin3_1_1]|nr:hypothetical protein [Trichodesmium sp. St17_bin3_1_1]